MSGTQYVQILVEYTDGLGQILNRKQEREKNFFEFLIWVIWFVGFIGWKFLNCLDHKLFIILNAKGADWSITHVTWDLTRRENCWEEIITRWSIQWLNKHFNLIIYHTGTTLAHWIHLLKTSWIRASGKNFRGCLEPSGSLIKIQRPPSFGSGANVFRALMRRSLNSG